MLTKDQFIEGFITELNIIRHLATKITPEMLDYRPTEKQRSLSELLNYLGHIFELGTDLTIAGSSKGYMDLAAKAPKATLENFDSVMDTQAQSLREKLGALSDAELAEVVEIWGWSAPRAIHLMGVMKWSVAYKMQLFLYLKSNGRSELETQNLWRGTDPAPKQ